MAKAVKKGTLLDVSYFLDDEKGIALNLFVKTQKGIEEFSEKKFKPYFYVVTDDAKKRLRELEKKEFGEEKIKPMKVEEVKKSNEENVLKLSFKNTHELITARESIEEMQGVKEKREYDIPFAKRFLIDQSIEPMNGLELEVNEKNEVQKLRVYNTKKDLLDELSVACFDIETYSPGRFSDPSRDPIVSIALSSGGKEKAFVWRQKPEKEKADFFETEKEMLEAAKGEFRGQKGDAGGEVFQSEMIKKVSNTMPGDEAETFTISLSLRVTAVFYDTEGIEQLAERKLYEQLSQGFTFLSVPVDQMHVTVTNILKETNEAQIRVELTGVSILSPTHPLLDKSSMVGRSPKELKDRLTSAGLASDVVVEIFPPWMKKIPALKDHVDVVVDPPILEKK